MFLLKALGRSVEALLFLTAVDAGSFQLTVRIAAHINTAPIRFKAGLTLFAFLFSVSANICNYDKLLKGNFVSATSII